MTRSLSTARSLRQRWLRYPRLAPAAMLALPTLSWLWALARFYRRFIYDDAGARVWGLADDVYISACFGRSLVQGAGFVWYAGAPRVEGVSNPLWAAIIGLLHKLPGFTEDRLGLFVVALNAALLVAVMFAFTRAAVRALGAGARERPVLVWTCAGAMLFLPWTWSLAYWSAEGFEVALVALLTLAAIGCGLAPRKVTRCVGLGFMVLAGIATRMDFAVLAVPVFVVAIAHDRGPRHLLVWALGVVAVGLCLLLLARRAYYGDWLPNTYYLKTTGWALGARLQRGVDQNRVLLMLSCVVWFPLAFPGIRRGLGDALPHVLAGWLGFGATVAYSTYVGGDAWRLFAGYDRHTVVGGVLLAWANCILFGVAARRWPTRLALGVWCVLLGAAASFAQNGATQLREGVLAVNSPLRHNEWDWIRYGKEFREVSQPGARIAICPAGAIVYFSHRGGVDLLGKVEPLVAHLDVSPYRTVRSACWRDAPGHNKGDDAAVFEARKPEFARGKLPAAQKALYFKLKHHGAIFLVRKDTTLLRTSAL